MKNLFETPCRAGFSLVEVTLALGIVTTAILSTLGLLTIGLEMNRDSVARTEAASVAREVVADLRMLDDWSSRSPRLQITPNPSGTTPTTFYVTTSGDYILPGAATDQDKIKASYRVDVSFGAAIGARPPALHVLVSWPAGAPGNGLWPALASSRYEAVASLNPL